MRYIDEMGMRHAMELALATLDANTHLHVSFDVDFLDPEIAPGVGTTVPGGPTYREAQLCMEMIADTGRLASLDVMELNPALDVRNKTAAAGGGPDREGPGSRRPMVVDGARGHLDDGGSTLCVSAALASVPQGLAAPLGRIYADQAQLHRLAARRIVALHQTVSPSLTCVTMPVSARAGLAMASTTKADARFMPQRTPAAATTRTARAARPTPARSSAPHRRGGFSDEASGLAQARFHRCESGVPASPPASRPVAAGSGRRGWPSTGMKSGDQVDRAHRIGDHRDRHQLRDARCLRVLEELPTARSGRWRGAKPRIAAIHGAIA